MKLFSIFEIYFTFASQIPKRKPASTPLPLAHKGLGRFAALRAVAFAAYFFSAAAPSLRWGRPCDYVFSFIMNLKEFPIKEKNTAIPATEKSLAWQFAPKARSLARRDKPPRTFWPSAFNVMVHFQGYRHILIPRKCLYIYILLCFPSNYLHRL